MQAVGPVLAPSPGRRADRPAHAPDPSCGRLPCGAGGRRPSPPSGSAGEVQGPSGNPVALRPGAARAPAAALAASRASPAPDCAPAQLVPDINTTCGPRVLDTVLKHWLRDLRPEPEYRGLLKETVAELADGDSASRSTETTRPAEPIPVMGADALAAATISRTLGFYLRRSHRIRHRPPGLAVPTDRAAHAGPVFPSGGRTQQSPSARQTRGTESSTDG
jgi:hypothetical protein